MITIADIATFLEPECSLRMLTQHVGAAIKGPAPIGEAGPGDVSFCGHSARDPQALLAKTRASLLIVDRTIPVDEAVLALHGVEAIIVSENARLHFIQLLRHFFSRPRLEGIDPSAVIAAAAVIAENAYVGPLCSIGQAEIGDGTVIHAGVHIYDHVRIGRNVTIHSGCVIGADGFGFERDTNGVLVKFPHLGGVVIEDDVEICALTHVARGTLADTVIGRGTKIDAFVQVAHNIRIGRHCVVTSHAMLAADAIGDFTWVAPCACVRDRLVIGSHATLGLGAVVTKDVPDCATVMGVPARPMDEQKRLLTRLRALAAD